jgi:hypothetical protein
MNKSKWNTSILRTTSVLAVFALAGTAGAGDDTYKSDEDKAAHAQKTQSMDKHTKAKYEEQQTLKKFGVAQLNDIEDWKIIHDGTELGEIDRLAVDRNSGELLAVVGLKGVTGANMKEVSVPLSKLQMTGSEVLTTSLTKDELQKKRDIDPWDGSFSQVIGQENTQ